MSYCRDVSFEPKFSVYLHYFEDFVYFMQFCVDSHSNRLTVKMKCMQYYQNIANSKPKPISPAVFA